MEKETPNKTEHPRAVGQYRSLIYVQLASQAREGGRGGEKEKVRERESKRDRKWGGEKKRGRQRKEMGQKKI